MTIFSTGVISTLMLAWSVVALESNSPELPQSLTDTICANRPRTQCEVELDVPEACATGNVSDDPSCPIVFFLHGSGGTNDGFARKTDVHEAGYIGVYPQGESGWNTGPKTTNTCDWFDYDCTTDPDEGDYIASIISEVRARGASGNVYAIGNSNGAALAHRLAANAGSELPIKGIVVKVTQLLASPERSGPGVLNFNQPSADRGTPAVSVLSVLGTDDGLIPYDGGSSAVFKGDTSFQLMSALDSMETWAAHNGCDGSLPVSSEHSTDRGTFTATKYDYSSGCPSGVYVEHYAIHGGEHNAGRATIDDEKIDYVIAYDFIDRVEAGAGGEPTTSSPGASPVASPPSDSCVNDPTWAGKFNSAHTCDYVASNPANRCGWENSNGVSANDACPGACNTDCSLDESTTSPVATPTSSPVASPVASPPSDSCVNDPTWAGKFNSAHTCDYVASNPANRCGWENSNGVSANDACPGACNTDCSLDESTTSPVATPTSSPVASPVASPPSDSCVNDPTWAGKFNSAHTCDYVASNPANRCGWENSNGVSANDACPEACSTDCGSRRARNRYLRNWA